MRRMLLALLAVLMMAVSFEAPQAQRSLVTDLAAINAAAKTLDAVLSKAITQVDDAAAARLRQLRAALRETIKETDDLLKNTAKLTNEVVDDAQAEVRAAVADLREETQRLRGQLADDLHSALVGASETLDGLPLVNVDPYLAAVSPRKLRPDAVNREVRVLGYFGAHSDKDPPVVVVNGAPVPTRKVRGGIAFDLPASLGPLREETFLNIRVDVKKKESYLWLFSRTVTETWNERLYVERLKPFVCSIRIFGKNPAAAMTVVATREYSDSARTADNGRKPIVNGAISAQDLFTATVEDATTAYEPTSARIVKPNARFDGSAACTDHSNWSGRIVRWNEHTVEYELRAPDIGPHTHSGWTMKTLWSIRGKKAKTKVPYSYLHGGGGGRATVYMKPEFVVAKKGVPDQVELPWPAGNDATFALSPRDRREQAIKLPAAWSLHVNCEYRDGDDRWSLAPMVLTPIDSAESAGPVTSRIESGVLYVISDRR